ncbi:peptidase inhibitor family I36 protein, partial [Curtobacterium sp. B8]|uniref:peptidase inhibitor family I36 protein n=1 Tax=Curtobacterium sp. B8 TaxID=95611 RepID=UPI0016514EB7
PAATVAVAGAILGGSVVSAQAASAACSSGHFCAYDGRNYAGSVMVDSSTTANATVDVADNRVASGQNRQNRKWCGVNVEGTGNVIRSRWQANTNIADLSPYNDTIDFFWAGTAGTC